MTTQLCIDCGNTRIKAGRFTDDRLSERWVGDYGQLAELRQWASHSQAQCAIMCGTGGHDTEVAALLAEALGTTPLQLTHEVHMPLALGYRTPHTLGTDRIATVHGAWAAMPGCNLLVVDAGTAITLDVVLSNGVFLGGNIAPGVTMRLQAMHEHTSRLPLVDIAGDVPLVGYDTHTAMRAGAVLGAAAEIDRLASQLRTTSGQLKVMLTGGDAHLLEQYLESANVDVDDDLLLHGLNSILSYQDENQ